MSVMDIASYDISPERGFLSSIDPTSIDLPDYLEPAVKTAMALPQLIPTGHVRKHLEAMPYIDLAAFCKNTSEAEQRAAMVHYSFMVQAYVWGEDVAPKSLPKCLAVPIWQLAEAIDQKPLLTYSGYVLDNWGRVDESGPIDLSNIQMLQPFVSGQDEAWFVLIHVAIEARAGEMLAAIPRMIDAVSNDDQTALLTMLKNMSGVWDDVNAIFNRMPERCDPYIYFHRVRPWIHGWKDNPALGNGLIYEGVEETEGHPQVFRGQTGSQSSIVPSMDAFLGIDHANDPLRSYLDELHAYRPPAHRRFIEDIRANSNLRAYVKSSDSKGLQDLYNEIVTKLAQFRTRHLEYAASYINKQANGGEGNAADVGTGGTPFMKYLKKHRDEAREHLVRAKL
ncbi:indoleamine 2,3-dioxygenase [Kordiimonas aquimaris]|uniref:indoleamine 2,3-dioxygenase n=1 Tax=Kordiimonas aquimaris TaxID=707591 RepID=UPI0021CED8F2|nr:indoleamine 2,3-dioxygenase [Kordiimonas aquimaris]